jgi:hypothetical protein
MPFFVSNLENGEPELANKIFRTEDYLASVEESNLAFMKDFTKTQLFLFFLEKAYGARKNPNEITNFIEAVELHRKIGQEAFSANLRKVSAEIIYNFKHVLLNILNLAYFDKSRRLS